MTAHLHEAAVTSRSLRVVREQARTAREYLRVSQDRRKKGRSPDQQHAENVEDAEEYGWVLGEPYRDDDRSASRYARKPRDDYQRLMRDLETGTFGADVLILWETSRGSRDMDDWVPFVSLLERVGVLVYVTSTGRLYDPREGQDREDLLREGLSNESDSRKTSKRVTRDARDLAKAGKPTGKCPVGYMREYDPRTGELLRQVPDPEKAPWVLELFERIAKGHALNQIARDFEERGIANLQGSPYSANHLRRIATTHAYAGYRVHVPGRRTRVHEAKIGPEHLIDAVWPEIVDRDLFWAVQAILSDPVRRTSRPGRANHLLSMIARCDVCGGPLVGRHGSGNGTARQWLLRCQNGHARILESDLDEWAEKRVLAYLGSTRLADRIAEKEQDGAALRAAREEVAALKARKAVLTKRLEAEDDADEILAAIRGIKHRLTTAEARAKELSTPDVLRGLIETGEGVEERWIDTPLSVRRQIAQILFAPDMLGELRVMPAAITGRRVPVRERVRLLRD